jgi:hypothetical protein
MNAAKATIPSPLAPGRDVIMCSFQSHILSGNALHSPAIVMLPLV